MGSFDDQHISPLPNLGGRKECIYIAHPSLSKQQPVSYEPLTSFPRRAHNGHITQSIMTPRFELSILKVVPFQLNSRLAVA